jgi:hypothetical protein
LPSSQPFFHILHFWPPFVHSPFLTLSISLAASRSAWLTASYVISASLLSVVVVCGSPSTIPRQCNSLCNDARPRAHSPSQRLALTLTVIYLGLVSHLHSPV